MNFAELELIPRVRWSDTEADHRVSSAEQNDYLPPVGAPSFWMLSAWVASPLIAIGAGSLLGSFF